MNEKINFQELITLLSEKAGITKKDTENFLREFFDLMSESILTDGLLKIKSLGTFKLVDVEERESINVRTGERVLIPAHKKISYIPEDGLSKIINEPFSMFSPVDLEDDLEDGATAKPTEEKQDQSEEEQGKINDKKDELEKIIIPEEVKEETVEDHAEDHVKAVIDETPPSPPSPSAEIDETPRTEKKNGLKTVGIIFFIAVAIAILIFFALPHIKQLPQFKNFGISGQNQQQADFQEKDEQEKQEDIAVLPDSSEITTPEDTVKPDKSPDKVEPKVIIENQSLKKRRIGPGERLTIIALQEYGHKAFWVYLYEENKSIIDNPGLVPAGLEIIIPAASKYGIDKENPESISKAKRIATELQ